MHPWRWFRFTKFKLRSRGSLVAATVLLQAAVIGAGWLFMMHYAQSQVSSHVHVEILDDNRRSAERFAAMLSQEIGGPIRPGTPEWERAQTLVETARLPRGAFLCLLDMENRVLCHPGLRHNPGLARADYSEMTMTLSPGEETATLGQLYPRSSVTGMADSLAGKLGFALVFAPDLHAKILVNQPEPGMNAAGQRVTSGMVLVAALTAALVLTLTTFGSFMLVQRYDTILMQINRDLEAEVMRKVKTGLAVRNALIFGLAKLADYRDTDTGKHLERISTYCVLLANELRGDFPEIDDAWVERIRIAASMHDIGKVGVPDSILLKPGAFTQTERRLMEQHPLIGGDTLVAIRKRLGSDDLLEMGIDVALLHHEKVDGSGYPFGLVGNEIALSARLVALADIYDALTSKRVYKSATTHAKAREIIVGSRGTHLDARIVDAFDRIHERFDQARHDLQPDSMDPEKPQLLTAVEQAAEAQKRAA